MKKTIYLLAILLGMAACTTKVQHPTQCELFGLHLGMPKQEALAVLSEKFGRPDAVDGEAFYVLENIYSDGVKYETVMFWFSDAELLADIDAVLPEVQDLYPHPDTKEKVLNALYDALHRVDSSLMLKHKLYNFPQTLTSYEEFDYIYTIAAKDLFNTEDIIKVEVEKNRYFENSYSISLSLAPLEKGKHLTK